jgi:hypothetical protein
MRVDSVIAAGLCFLTVAAPSASPAQSPRAKAATGVIKQTRHWMYATGETHHWKYVTGEGWKIDPPYRFFGDHWEVGKLPKPVKWIAGSSSGFGAGAWWCSHTGWWCPKQKSDQ